MRVVKTELGTGTPLIDKFTFDDGIIILLQHDSKFIFRQLEVSVVDNLPTAPGVTPTPKSNFHIYKLLWYGLENGGERGDDWKYADYIYYIISTHLSFVNYFKMTNEWFNIYSTQYEYHNNLDIKHRCRNLRKAGKFAWGHYDILRNMDEYVNYAKVSRFCRETLLNFYTRFLKLSILNNNKRLSWIIDETDSFINYGFVLPLDERIKDVRCGCKEVKYFGAGCVLKEHENTLSFTYVTSDEADSWEETKIVCDHQIPHPDDKERICAHQQYYKPKTRFNKRVGVRQKTEEFVKMQLTDDQPFTINGVACYTLYDYYADRMSVKSKSENAGLILMRYLYNSCTIEIATAEARDPNELIPLVVETQQVPLSNKNIEIAVRHFILNKAGIRPLLTSRHFTPQYFETLFQVIKHKECQSGRLTNLKELLLKAKLMIS